MPIHIVILGGGFGGIYSLLSLRKQLKKIPYTVTLISDKKYFSFTPFLSQVAANLLPFDEAMANLNDLVRGENENFKEEKAESINLITKRIHLHDGSEISYDYLVIAIGSTTNFLHVPGAQEHALVLKDITDANYIRERIETVFAEADIKQTNEERKAILSFAIIGGGPTGIEIAADIEDHIEHLLHTSYPLLLKADTCVTLINSGNEIAKEFDPAMRKKAASLLMEENVILRLNSRVKELQEEKVIFTNDQFVKAHTIIWSAGVKANALSVTPATVINAASQKFIVDPYLRLSSFPEVFTIGDIAQFADTTKKLPMLAQAAVSEGICTGKNIARSILQKKLLSYTYHSKGELISIGKGEGIASIYHIDISGRLAWFIWRIVYLYKFIGNRKKPAILFHWIMDLFS